MWWSVPGCLVQGVGVFLLPFVVALPAALFFETSEVVDTLPAMLAFTAVVLAPVSVVQVLGLILKSRRELAFWRKERALGPKRLLDVLYRHVSVVTLRGWVLLFGGLFMTVFALGWQWASLGVIAVLSLLLFYLVVGWTLFVSTFHVRSFERGLGRQRAGIERQMLPAVALAGEPVDEVLRFRQVPVPWGYMLTVDDPNPARLRTESRYAVGVSARSGEIEARGGLRATPRGLYHLGPARIGYQDVFGITRVSVASLATAELKVLPRMQPVQIVDPPRTPMQAPDIVTRPHRYATEDHFRFREFQHGDDTRRIHWRLSMKAGRLHVRLPESRETSTEQVLLVLDSFLPRGRLLDASHGGDEILDALVLAWLGIARELVERGNRVTLLAAAAGHDRDSVVLETIEARKGQVARWQDLGARCRWQGAYDLPQLLDAIGEDAHGVVVTARFTAPPPGPFAGRSTTWLFMDPSDALGRPDPHWVNWIAGPTLWRKIRWLFQLPHPVGSEDNSVLRRARDSLRTWRLWHARRTLRRVARRRAGRTLSELEGRGDAIYRIERTPNAIKLVGLRAQEGERRRRLGGAR